MYTAILVDDDLLTIKKLENIFPWDKYSFKLVASISNPEEAFYAMSKLNPHVIFTDISMCDIDGFQLIEYAQQKKLRSLFVIISGYGNFDYAQKAIRNNVVDYMLKPISAADCDELLCKLKKKLDDLPQITPTTPSKKYQIHNKAFRDMIEYINNNYMERLSLSTVADMYGLNVSYCCQLFKKYFNCNFSSYITTLKMNHAVELLKTDMKMSDIADFLGYEYTYFCKTFKKHFQVTPHIYRKKHHLSEESWYEEE